MRNGARHLTFTLTLLCVLAVIAGLHAQESSVPRAVPFNGHVLLPTGDARTGTALLTFGLYTDQTDGAPLWTEQQLVTLDASGRYSVILGSTRPEGLPADAFTAGTPKWLGVQVESEPEQPRVMLLSVPYALKAADADTVGGTPATEFVVRANLFDSVRSTLRSEGYAPRPANPTTSVPGVLAVFTDASNSIGNSNVVQNGSNIGINVSPSYPLHVFGATGGPFGYQTLRLDNPHVAGSSFTLGPTIPGTHVYSILSSGPASALGAGSFGVYDEGSGQFRVVIGPTGNVGNGTITPGFPLSFPNTLGDKIALWGQSGNHYGFGIQGGLLQVFSDAIGADIAFGWGRSTSFNEVMRIKGNGSVGIGANPSWHFTVQGTDTSSTTPNVVVTNSVGGDPGKALVVWNDRTVEIGALYGSSTVHACLNAMAFSACSSAAEYVPTAADASSGSPETGDLVSLQHRPNPYADDHAPFVVAKTASACDPNLLGFLIDPASGADGKKLNEQYLPLAIYGYFPAKVTTENGAIKRGDPITSSSRPGVGMKSTGACRIVGYALEDADQDGTIQVFAHLSESSAPAAALLQTDMAMLRRDNAELQTRLDHLEQAFAAILATRNGTAHAEVARR